MRKSNKNFNPRMSDASDISKPWDKDNQAWWDWYVSLADNDVKAVSYTHLTLPTNQCV